MPLTGKVFSASSSGRKRKLEEEEAAAAAAAAAAEEAEVAELEVRIAPPSLHCPIPARLYVTRHLFSRARSPKTTAATNPPSPSTSSRPLPPSREINESSPAMTTTAVPRKPLNFGQHAGCFC